MVRFLLLRGMVAGVIAGLLSAAFAYVFGVSAVEAGIAYEDRTGAGTPTDELISRGIQSSVGLTTAVVVYGAAVGGLFALVFALVHGRAGRWSARATAAAIAIGGFVAVFIVPFLKYPANPPGSSADGTISSRTGLYVVMVLISVALAGISVLLARRLAVRWGVWSASVVAAAAYVSAVSVVAIVMPVVDETPPDFPAPALYDFRLASAGGQLVLWAALGLAFGDLVERRAPATTGSDPGRPPAA